MSEIVTGRQVISLANKGSGEERTSTVLFDANSTSRVSHVVTIEDGQALKLSSFGLPKYKGVKIHRVYLGGGKMGTGKGCCDNTKTEPVQILMSEPLRIDCRDVTIVGCTNVEFLTIPGSYTFELETEVSLGDVIVLAETVQCSCLPEYLIIGQNKPYIGGEVAL